MAKIRDFTVTEFVASADTWVPYAMPVHEAGDLLVAFLAKDSTTGWTQSTGWTEYIDQATAQANVGCQCKRAASSAEAFSVTLTSETGVLVILAIQDVYGSSLADCLNVGPVVAGADDSTIPYAGISGQSTNQNDCLILLAFGADGGIAPMAHAPAVNLYNGDATNGSLGVAYTYKKVAGAIQEIQWFGRSNEDGRAMLVAIRSSGSGARQGYSDPGVSVGRVVRPLVGLSTMMSDSWPTSLTLTYLGDDWNQADKYVSGTPTGVTSALNDAATADVTLPIAIGDMLYLGRDVKSRYINLNVSTAGVTGVLVWEYWNGSTWVSTNMPTGNLTATGWTKLTIPDSIFYGSAWQKSTENSYNGYWVRARISTAYTTAVILTQGRCDGYAAAYIVSTTLADAGVKNAYCDACQCAGASSTTTLNGPQLNLGAVEDLDTGILLGAIRPVLPRDFAVDIALPREPAGGIQLTLLDAANLYASYNLGTKAAPSLNMSGYGVFAVDWNGAAVPWGVRGAINKSAVSKLYFSTYGYYGAAAIQWSMLILASVVGVAGGSVGTPLNFDDLEKILNNCIGPFPLMERLGAGAMFWTPLQIGGEDPVAIHCDLNTFQFPTRYDGWDYLAWNAADNVAGVLFYPKSGDVVKFTNCVFTSSSPYRFEFHASSSVDATCDFTGTTVVGATVTLRGIDPFDKMSFINCPSFTQYGATITNSKFLNTKVSSASPGDADNISNSSFTKNTGTQHALEIGGSAADITLTGLTFSGYAGSDGSTGNEAIYVNIATGAMTITIAGGGSVPSIRTAGCVVTVVSGAVTVKAIAQKADGTKIQSARVLLRASAAGAFPYNATVTISNSGTTATVTHSAHGMLTGDKVQITGASHWQNNGVFSITKIDSGSYSYTLPEAPGSSPTGTIKCSFVYLEGLTDVNGEISMTRVVSSDQAVMGWARKSSGAPYYKEGPLSGTVDDATGGTFTAILSPDE